MHTFRFQVKYNTFSVLVIYALRILMITWRHWPVMFMLLEEILMRQVFDCCPHPALLTQLFSKLPLAWENSWYFATPPQKNCNFHWFTCTQTEICLCWPGHPVDKLVIELSSGKMQNTALYTVMIAILGWVFFPNTNQRCK